MDVTVNGLLSSRPNPLGSRLWRTASSLQEAGIQARSFDTVKRAVYSAKQGGTTGFSSLFIGERPVFYFIKK